MKDDFITSLSIIASTESLHVSIILSYLIKNCK